MSPRRAERETNEVDPKIFSGNCINAVATFEISSEMRNIFTRSWKRCHTRTFFRQRKRFFCLLRNIIFERLISKKSFYPLRHSFPASFQKIINSSFSFYLIFIWLLSDYKYTCFRFFFFFLFVQEKKRKEGRKGGIQRFSKLGVELICAAVNICIVLLIHFALVYLHLRE